MRLTVRQFVVYHQCAQKFENRKQLRAFESSMFGYQDKEVRKKLTDHYTPWYERITDIISDPREVEESWNFVRNAGRKR